MANFKRLLAVAIALGSALGRPVAAQELVVQLPGGAELEMIWVDPGVFWMGTSSSDIRQRDEFPAHQVTISRGFYLGKYEITQAQWEAVMGTRPWAGLEFVVEDPEFLAEPFTGTSSGSGPARAFRVPRREARSGTGPQTTNPPTSRARR